MQLLEKQEASLEPETRATTPGRFESGSQGRVGPGLCDFPLCLVCLLAPWITARGCQGHAALGGAEPLTRRKLSVPRVFATGSRPWLRRWCGEKAAPCLDVGAVSARKAATWLCRVNRSFSPAPTSTTTTASAQVPVSCQ